MTIKSRTTGFGLKRLGDGVAALVLQGMVVKFLAGGGGLGTAVLRPGGQKQSEPPDHGQQCFRKSNNGRKG